MAKNAMKRVNQIVLWFAAVGALNWLLTSLAQFNLVETITTALNVPQLATLIYTIIGASGVWLGILVLMGKVKVTN